MKRSELKAASRLIAANKKADPQSWDDLYSHETEERLHENGYPSLDKENAVLRKTIAQLIKLFAKHTTMRDAEVKQLFAEFYALNQTAEDAKAEVKSVLD